MTLVMIALATMAVVETVDALVDEVFSVSASIALLWVLHAAVGNIWALLVLESPLVGTAGAGLGVAIGVVLKRIATPPLPPPL